MKEAFHRDSPGSEMEVQMGSLALFYKPLNFGLVFHPTTGSQPERDSAEGPDVAAVEVQRSVCSLLVGLEAGPLGEALPTQ